jgi:hypothetical protein
MDGNIVVLLTMEYVSTLPGRIFEAQSDIELDNKSAPGCFLAGLCRR